MKKEIWKYTLPIQRDTELCVPPGAVLLHVVQAPSSGGIALWMMVNPDAMPVMRRFAVIGTGECFDDLIEEQYVGTAILGGFVWHVFDRGEAEEEL